MPLTPEQKKNLLIGGGVGALALLGVALLGRSRADAAPLGPGTPQPLQVPSQQLHPPAQARPEHHKRKKRRHRDDDNERGERGERTRTRHDDNGRGEYGRKKHKRRHGD